MNTIKNPRYRAFLENYAKTFDPIGSFVAAGLKAKRAGGERAEAMALLEMPKHIEYLRQLVERKDEIPVSGDRVLEELSQIAFSTITDACEWTTTGVVLKPPSEIPAHKIRGIQTVSTHSDAAGNRNVTVKMHDKLGALKVLAKHFNVDVGINDLISRIRSYGYEVIDTTAIDDDPIEIDD